MMETKLFDARWRGLATCSLMGLTIVFVLLSATGFRAAIAETTAQALTLAERIRYERELQTVHLKHRMHAAETSQPRPTLDEVLPVAASQAKVEEVLRTSNALERAGLEITPAMLQAEMERMSRETRRPDILRELWNALGNDPRLVAECLARPILVERLSETHAAVLESQRAPSSPHITEQSFSYQLPAMSAAGGFQDDTWKSLPVLPDGFFEHTMVWTGAEMLVWGGRVRDGSARAGYEYFARAGAATRFDFDGDGRADISVFRPANGTWYLSGSQSGFSATSFGVSSDGLVPADYDGDGCTDLAVFRDGVWHLLRSTQGLTSVSFGLAGEVPVASDYDSDGKADLAVFRPSSNTWYVQHSSDGSLRAEMFGASGDLPVPGDYDGDGETDIAVFRPSAGTWYIRQSSDDAVRGQAFGLMEDRPVAADYDGDGKTDIAVYRPSQGAWYLLESSGGLRVQQFGLSGDAPVAADYDGDGKADVAVYRQGVWYLLQSTNNALRVEQFGAAGDVPARGAF